MKLKRPHPKMAPAEYNGLWLANIMRQTVTAESGCMEFTGFIGHNGYGQIMYRGKSGRVHREVYKVAKGPIPQGHDVCHSCDNRKCINPAHLWTGTRQQNLVDCLLKKRHHYKTRTHCKHGHEFNAENTLIVKTPVGTGRQCKVCKRISTRLKAGWTREQAESIGVVRHGQFPVRGKWRPHSHQLQLTKFGAP